MLNLNKLLKKWQKILRLQDWDITIEYGASYDMKESFGRTVFNTREWQAKIQLLNPKDYDPSQIPPYDIEETLIHELIHLHLASFMGTNFPEDDILFDNTERTINILARALKQCADGD